MTNKELLIQEIEIPPEFLTDALDLIRSIKSSHAEIQLSKENNSSSNEVFSMTDN